MRRLNVGETLSSLNDKNTAPQKCPTGFHLATMLHSNGIIGQKLQICIDGTTDTVSRWVIDTRESGFRRAMMHLGWLPPDNGETAQSPAAEVEDGP